MVSGPSSPACLGGVDHGEPDAVLDRTGRVEELELGQDLDVAAGVELVDANERRVADEFGDAVRDLGHGRSLLVVTPRTLMTNPDKSGQLWTLGLLPRSPSTAVLAANRAIR